MASLALQITLLIILAIFANSWMAIAGDPDILSDFLIPENVNASQIDGNFFSYTGLRGVFDSAITEYKANKVHRAEFPALDGQSVSLAVLQFPPGRVNPPHFHPRCAELLFVLKGTLEVGFVDTTNKLYHQRLRGGDLFVFPKGLIHYQYNSRSRSAASAVSAFGSASPGKVVLPTTLFPTDVDDAILAKNFKTDVATIQKIKAGLASKF